MIAYLLFEAADIAYTLSKFGYNSARATYFWYYGLPNPDNTHIQHKEHNIQQLQKRVETLERLLQQTHTTTNTNTEDGKLCNT
jgi:hypothetical protein